MAAIEVTVSALRAQPIGLRSFVRPSRESIQSISRSPSDLEQSCTQRPKNVATRCVAVGIGPHRNSAVLSSDYSSRAATTAHTAGRFNWAWAFQFKSLLTLSRSLEVIRDLCANPVGLHDGHEETARLSARGAPELAKRCCTSSSATTRPKRPRN